MNLDHSTEEDIFEAAFKLKSHEARSDYLRQVCRDDDQIERIQALLKEGDPEASFLEKGPAALQKDGNRPPDLPERIGDFEILGELGRGGMGVVYRARQCSLNRLVAMKVLSSGLGLTTKAIMRFKLEAEAAAKLHHSNIVPIYWTGEEKRVPYYAMELIDGPSLDRVIKQLRAQADTSVKVSGSDTSHDQHVPDWIKETLIHSAPGAGETTASTGASSLDSSSSFGSESSYYDNLAEMMADVADALAHAHDQGVVHRDIKPANLLLSSDGRLSINDFGLARMLEQPGMTMTGELMGSPMYMSPEQITAGRLPLDHRTDIYSLGASLYELLTLTPPFPGQQRDQVLSQVIHKDPPRPRSINPQIPRDLETICLKAMEKDPDRRYQTAEQMARDLRCFVNRHAISARRTGPAERALRWARKNKALTAMVSLTLLIGVVAAGFGYHFLKEKRGLVNEKLKLVDENARLQREQAIEKALGKAMSADFVGALKLIEEPIHKYDADPNWKPMIEAQQDLFEGKAAAAVAKLEEVVRKDPDNTNGTAQWMLAQAYWANGQAALTFSMIRELNDRKPSSSWECLFAAKALAMHRPDEAMDLLEEVIDENFQFTNARIARASLRVFQAMDKDDIDLVDQALADIQLTTGLLEEEQEEVNPTLCSDRLYAHLTAAYLYRRRGDDNLADKHLKDAEQDALYLEVKYPNYRMGNFARLYYYQFKEDFDGMHKVMQNVIESGHRGWIADPFWVTCYMNPEWAHRDARWAEVQLDDLALELLGQMPHQEDDYVAFTRLIFRLEKASGPEDVEDIYRVYHNQRASGMIFDSPALLLTGQRPASRQLAKDALETIKKMNVNLEASDHLFALGLQYGAGEIKETEYLDRVGRSHRQLVQARFGIGLHKLSEGKRQEALDSFQDATSGTMYHWTPFNWSRALADRLEKDKGWPHWPKLSGSEKSLKDEPD